MITRRQKIAFHLLKPFFRFYAFKKYRLKMSKNIKFDQKRNYLILVNHPTAIDSCFAALLLKHTPSFLATDDLINNSFGSRLLNGSFNIIPKRKGIGNDYYAVKKIIEAVRNRETIIIAPEGNRTFDGRLCYINPSIIKLIKKINIPVILFASNGGYGVDPRWGMKTRKGFFKGEIKRIIEEDEIKSMKNEELYECLLNDLSYKNYGLYKSPRRAEALERILYVCPICGAISQMRSAYENVYCDSCGLKVTYQEDLTLKSDNKLFKFNKIADWYDYQLEYVKKYDFNHQGIIYSDCIDELYTINNKKKEVLVKNGYVSFSPKEIVVYDDSNRYVFPIEDISEIMSLMKTKMTMNFKDKTYTVLGYERFNNIKYVEMFYHIKGNDSYFGI